MAESKQLSGHFVFVDGIRTHYLEGGVGFNGPPIIFLHGWGLSSTAFKSTLEELASTHHVIGLDVPGFGRTRSNRVFPDYVTYAKFVADFLDTLHIDKVVAAGQSMGGGICLALAGYYPGRVEKLILANSSGVPVRSLAKVALTRAQEVSFQAIKSRLVYKNLHMSNAFLHNLATNFPRIFLTAQVPLRHDLRPVMRSIKVPTLLVWAKRDNLFPVRFGEEMHSLLSNSKLITIEDGYHEWSLIHSKDFAQLVNEFLR